MSDDTGVAKDRIIYMLVAALVAGGGSGFLLGGGKVSSFDSQITGIRADVSQVRETASAALVSISSIDKKLDGSLISIRDRIAHHEAREAHPEALAAMAELRADIRHLTNLVERLDKRLERFEETLRGSSAL